MKVVSSTGCRIRRNVNSIVVSGFWVVMDDDLERMCSKISLTNGEKIGINVSEGDVVDIREKSKNCLVGKLWTEKPVNKEAFKTVLSRIWRLAGRVVFKELQDNCWLFDFSTKDDKRRVLEGRPWSFDRHALVLKAFDGKTAVSQMRFTHSPIWIQVHDMLLLCMNRGVGLKIGASLGEIVDVDVAGDGSGWGRCLRLRVVINLFIPLERGRALEFEGKSHWVTLKYEKLLMCCFHCGRIVHERQGCPIRKNQRVNVDEGEKKWGTWIRADVPKREKYDKGGSNGWFNPSEAGSGSGSSGGRRETSMADRGSADGGGNPSSDRQRDPDNPREVMRTRGVVGDSRETQLNFKGVTWGGSSVAKGIQREQEDIFKLIAQENMGQSSLARPSPSPVVAETSIGPMSGIAKEITDVNMGLELCSKGNEASQKGSPSGEISFKDGSAVNEKVGPSLRGFKRQARSTKTST